MGGDVIVFIALLTDDISLIEILDLLRLCRVIVMMVLFITFTNLGFCIS